MGPSRSICLIVIVALAATVGAVVWLVPGDEQEVTLGDGVARASDLESMLGVRAAQNGEVDQPRSLHSVPGREPGRRDEREHRPGSDVSAEATVPAGAHSLVRVREGSRVPIRTRPGGDLVEFVGARTEFGSPTVFGVVRTAGLWVGVSTPALPNDKLGWIRLDQRLTEMGWTERSIQVSLSERRATLREGDEELFTFTITIGAPGTNTPTGRFAVTDTFRGDLNPVYGCCAVALSATQPDLPAGWPGGNRIAFHGNGTGQPLGIAASNGCLRAEDEDVSSLIDEVDLGTPVLIRD